MSCTPAGGGYHPGPVQEHVHGVVAGAAHDHVKAEVAVHIGQLQSDGVGTGGQHEGGAVAVHPAGARVLEHLEPVVGREH